MAIRERGLNPDVTRCDVHVRLHGRDLAAELLPRIRIRSGRDGEAFAHLAEPLLRQRELHIDGVERLQRHDRYAFLEKVADAHAPDAYFAGKRCAHDLLRDHGADVVDLRLRLLPRGLRLLEVGLRDRALRDQALRTLEGEACELGGRLGRSKLALLDLVVEQHELVASLDDGARFEANRAHDAVGFGADLGSLHGDDGADAGHLRLPVLTLHRDRVHALGRRHLGGERLADCRELHHLDPGDDPDDQHHGDEADSCGQRRPSFGSLLHASAPSAFFVHDLIDFRVSRSTTDESFFRTSLAQGAAGP